MMKGEEEYTLFETFPNLLKIFDSNTAPMYE